jgi:hypothetical protein
VPGGFATERTCKAHDRASSHPRAPLGDPVVDERVTGTAGAAEGNSRPRRERFGQGGPNCTIGAWRTPIRQWELDHLEEKVRAADVHLNRLKRMAGDYPSATWENEMLNHDAEKALRSLLVFAQSLPQFNSDTVFPVNLQLLDQIQLAANGLVELIHHFMATHRQAEKPIPSDA